MVDAHRALLGIFAQEVRLNQLPAQVDNILHSPQTQILQILLYLECQPVLFHHHAIQRDFLKMQLDAFLVLMEQCAPLQETLSLAPTPSRVLVLLLVPMDLSSTMAFALNVSMIISSVQVALRHLLLFLMDIMQKESMHCMV